MKWQIIRQMSETVCDVMRSYQIDFYSKDLNLLHDYEGEFIWQVSPTHTHLSLIDPNKMVKDMETNEYALYDYARNDTWAAACLNCRCSDELIFYYDGKSDMMVQIERDKAIATYNERKDEAIAIYKQQVGVLPSDLKVRIEFASKEVRSEFIKQVKYAQEHEDGSLMDCVKHFQKYPKHTHDHKFVIYKDMCERCFQFTEYLNGRVGLHGGIIFHGYPKEGYKQNGSCQIEPSYGWSTHT